MWRENFRFDSHVSLIPKALKYLQKELLKENFNVYVVPEVPTLTMEGGGMI